MSTNNKKISICYLIDFLSSGEGLTGGTERQLFEIIHRLDRTKYNLSLFCLRENQKSSIFELISCEKNNLNVYSFKSIKSLRKLFVLAKFLRQNEVDIVQAFFFDSIFFGTFAAKLAGVKYFISSRRDMGFWYSKIILKNLLFINQLTTRILVNSKAVKDHVAKQEKVSPQKIDVIYNGIDLRKVDSIPACNLSREFKEIHADDKIVGIVANFNRPVKRVDLFIKALAEVLRQHGDVKFLVIGEGNLKKSLVELAETLGVQKNLVWAGRKENVLPYVKGFTIGVQPSDSEGFSNSILEYMASGLPVVATDVGGNPELVCNGKSGFLVPPGDHIALAEKISHLLSNEKLSRKMGEEGRRFVKENFDWDKKIKEIEEYYQGLVKN